MSRTSAFLIVMSLLVVIYIACVEFVLPYDPLAQQVSERLLPPGGTHLLGTDGFGRDQLSRILVGVKNSLLTGLISLAIAGSAGVLLGSASAYYRGPFDFVVQRLVDLFLGIPFLVICIIFVIVLRPSVFSVALALGFVLTPQVIRLARASVLALLDEPFVEAARLCGTPSYRILLRHLIPNALAPIVAQLSGLFGVSITAEASLSYLGLGIPAPYPSLGRMLKEGAGLMLEAAPWLTVFPGIAIAILVFAAAFSGDLLASQRNTREPR